MDQVDISEDVKAADAEYLIKHNVKDLLAEMYKSLLVNQPDDPIKHLIEQLVKRHK